MKLKNILKEANITDKILMKNPVSLKTKKGKKVTLKKGDKGTHQSSGNYATDLITIAGHEFDAKEWDKMVEPGYHFQIIRPKNFKLR